MTKFRNWVVGGIVLVLLGGSVFYVVRTASADSGESSANASEAAAGEAGMAVRTKVLETSSLDHTLRLTGTLRADEYVALRAEIAAKVAEIVFREGETVESGDLLVKLDDTELQAELQEIEADLNYARREEARQKRLFEDESTSERQLEEAENRRALLEARMTTLQARLEKTEIRAPFSGTVGLREISPGSLVQADTRLASLQRLEPLKIDFSVPERYVGDLKPGLEFEVEVAGTDQRYPGVVYAREPGIDPETRTVRLRGRIENSGGRLLPGGYAQVFLTLDRRDDALVVPTVAVVPGRESSVFVVEDDVAHRRPVELGRRVRDSVQILDGLETGETVVVAGMQNIRDGARVRVLTGDQEKSAEK